MITDQNIHVVFVDSVDPNISTPGGVGPYVDSLIRAFQNEGVKVTLLGTIRSHGYTKPTYNFIPIMKSQKISSYHFLFNLILKVARLSIPSDAIIHVQRTDTLLPFILFCRRNKKVCTLHAKCSEEIRKRKGFFPSKIFEIIEKFVLKHIDRVIAVDEDIKRYYLQKFPWLKKKIVVIPTGIQTDEFKPIEKSKVRQIYGFKNNDKIILYAGRFEEKQKNLSLLLQSFKLVKEEVKNSKLVLVGNGKGRQMLDNLIKELDLKDVVFMGVVERKKLPEIINCADVFALSSNYEGSPNVVKEALACGVPVVSTNVGDVHKIIKNGENGYIVERDKYLMANGLIKAISDHGFFKGNCIKSIEGYGYRFIGKRTMEVYNEILKKG